MSNNLPIQVKKGFLNISKEQKKKVGRFFKAIGYSGLVTASFGIMWVAGPSLISLLSLPALGVGTYRSSKKFYTKYITRFTIWYSPRKKCCAYRVSFCWTGSNKIKVKN